MGDLVHIPIELGTHGYIFLFGLVAAEVLGVPAVLRYARRRKLLSQVRDACITPRELYDLILNGSHPMIVDLRHPLDMFTDPWMIPGAIRLPPNQLSTQGPGLPRNCDIILYCTCNEASSVSTALRLRKMGITSVRPLLGGFDAWKQLNYPLEEATDKIGWIAQKRVSADSSW